MNDASKLLPETIRAAYDFAYKAHGAQTRKGTQVPYLIHPLGVARLLFLAKASEPIIMAGLLHDVLEDGGKTAKDVEKEFGAEVARLVEGASEPDHHDPWKERKQHTMDYLGRDASVDVVAVALADKLDNLMAMHQDLDWFENKSEFWTRFKKGYEPQRWYYKGLLDVFEKRKRESHLLEKLVPRYAGLVGNVFGK